ncbi:Uncharacterized protein BM_BM9814 [Brugia malayi]|uniref:Bm9814 n=1 Tax=Brugia malayi TaxID=6279 RepID=A0A0K0K0K3_BRUMA|nr:Uncharacterized protein BM_BM9814 [Brugia malayi]CRZ24214.1 Bm9814 [Brugia malayi]VIO94538.1 Uncharacterized protein BM_BM9814 [Brugia malayi]
MHSNTTNNYDCTPLLSNDNNGESGTSQAASTSNRSWLRRVISTTSLFEKSLSTIRSTGLFQESRDNGQLDKVSGYQWNDSCCQQQYGANGGYASNRVCSTRKVDVSEHSAKGIRIYWRVM